MALIFYLLLIFLLCLLLLGIITLLLQARTAKKTNLLQKSVTRQSAQLMFLNERLEAIVKKQKPGYHQLKNYNLHKNVWPSDNWL